ncbi:NF-X1-type zinc finger protein NFXL1 [Biomphalaria glabrata]|uniref:NF-X1-type zinc finger protein NFXL1-like n=1 Tax=Biomphalaria glabrata TaxID=6526 RepID=A0A9W3B521_BIOGL|nr:NF-X1-type zinc finger protein NFXL1-like [Biomphalaria glabrata]KAI8757393.1 NF-X1-type zinc finger protein NFXL1-like [Biomphalaria glabrata]
MASQPAYLHGRGRGRGTRNQNVNHTSHSYGQFQTPNGNSPVRPGQKLLSNNGLAVSSPTSPSGENRLEASLKSVEDMFAEARNKHMESAQRHLTNTEAELDESEDEEDIGSLVLDGVFQSYSKTFDSGNRNDVQSAQEKLLHSFRSGTSACLVCIETIKKEEAIWNCYGCFCMFHITCIQKWVREGVYQKQYSSGDFIQEKSSTPISWHCPKCRHEYSQNESPTKYFCFCGKVENPKFDPWFVPHSCGAVCGRKLQPHCGHTCLLLCHPGACPPCPMTVASTCYCEKSSPRMVRCSAKSWSCGKTCGRLLSCKQHKCTQTCHSGVCPPCVKTSFHPCLCGKDKAERPCDSISWHCDKMCGKPLNCGNHVCEVVCHDGKCGSCPRSGLRKCPCGKTEYKLPCTEDIPTCGDTCGKPLACSQHTCTGRCHLGECGQCMQMSVKKCRCGQRQKEVPCAKEFLCEKKCSNMRNCGVHKCNRKCCDGNCPSCEQVCGKTLKCRNHKCASRCHKGPCYPCPLTVSVTCNCQATKISVPCGKERQTKPPRCNIPCQKPSECHHPVRQKHRCHFGDCPACNYVCGQKLDKCEHTCPVMCHDAVMTKVEDKSVKVGPWDAKPVIIQKIAKQCPPCQVLIAVQCLGKHETSEIPCSRVKPYSCGRKCGRQLSCGNHLCQLDCHKVTDITDSDLAGEECQKCESGCEAKRPDGCSHPCVKPCHPPPCPPCHMMIRMRCHCQTLVKHIECVKWISASSAEKDMLKSCEQPCPKEMACGHPCGATCHSGSCPNTNKCDKKVILKCKCKRIKREIFCRDKDCTPKPECDSNCKPKTQNLDDMAKIKEKEDLKKQEAELQEYERMMRGRKKKPRKHKEEAIEESFFSKYKLHILFSLSVLTASSVAVYLAYV